MPCYTPPSIEDTKEGRLVKAALCGILRTHGMVVLDGVDWREVGAGRKEVENWWEQHLKEDEQRRT